MNAHLDTLQSALPAGPGQPQPPLRALLIELAAAAPLPGPILARRLGVSPAAVRKRVAALRRAGLDIRSDRGYRLIDPVEWLDPVRMRAALPPLVRRRLGVLECHWRIGSTSTELARRARSLPDRSFVFADWQQAGRGRRGRRWLSPPALNLQFSCLKRFAGGYAGSAGLSLAMGVAVVRALVAQGVPGLSLKWPNDVLVGGAKLGGILVELGGDNTGPCHAIVGIGINIRVPGPARAALERPCADLTELCGGAPPARTAFAVALIAELVDALDAFAVGGFAAFANAWSGYDALAGRRVMVEGASGAFTGTAAGVDARGMLQVRIATGVRSVGSAEVSVRPA